MNYGGMLYQAQITGLILCAYLHVDVTVNLYCALLCYAWPIAK